MTVYNLLLEQILKNPDSTAIIFGEQKLTYGQLDKEINKLTSYLVSTGVKSGDFVGVSLNRSVEMVTTLLSLMKIGATYIPLDPAFPPNRLRFIVEDSRCPHLITENSIKDSFSYYNGNIIDIENYNSYFGVNVSCDDVNPDNVVYILYTSGSTGKPKGVQITHKSLVNFLKSMKNTPGLNENDSLLAITTLSFDISGLEIYLPLITGAKLVIASKEETVDGKKLLELLRKDITVLQATPSTWKLMLDSGWNEKFNLKALCGGEALSRDLADKILERVDSLWNMYGPTETTIWSSCSKVEVGNGIIQLGRPIANTQFYIVDKNNQFCAPGVPGELLIGGDGLSIGYLNREELTKEKFITNPFDKEKKSIVYRTGDLVRITPKKEIEFLGRIDNQVKIRGFRIELGEIENAIRKSELIKDAAVIAKQFDNNDHKLVAFCVPEATKMVSNGIELKNEYTAKIKSLIKESLPDYMVPPFFNYVENFPLTPNGKIDRKELEKINFNGHHHERKIIAPKNDTEDKLVQIWKRLLLVDEVSTDDNFFELGGHSIVAAQMFTELENETGIRLPLALLFKHQTIAEIVSSINGSEWKHTWSPVVLIKQGKGNLPLFLIHGAEGNILLYRDIANHLAPEFTVYGIQARGLNGSHYTPGSIEEMAIDYIEAIKKVQPNGPYNLGGYCLGGTIAYEVAQQLSVRGDEVKNLFLIETYNVCFANYSHSFSEKTKEKFENVKFHYDNLMSLKGSERKTFIKQKAEVAKRRLMARINSVSSKIGLGADTDPETSAATLTIREVNDKAQEEYVPVPYNGKTILLKPKVSYSSEPDPSFGWNELVSGEFKIYNLELAPRGMLLEPFVSETASIIKNELKNI